MKFVKVKNIINAYHKLSKSEREEFLEFLFYDVEAFKNKKKKLPAFDFKIGLAIPKKGVTHMLDVTITDEQKIPVTVTPTTATGKPATLDGAPTWTIQSGDSTISVAADGLSAFLISADTPGDTNILVEADADLGAGVQTISDVIQLHVTGAQAANLGLSVGKAEPKP